MRALQDIRKLAREPGLLFITIFLMLSILIFILFPLSEVFIKSLNAIMREDSKGFFNLLFSDQNMKPLKNSLTLGATVAVTGTFVGYVFSYIVTMTSVPFKRFFRFVSTFPIISPPFIIALAGIMLFGQNGVLTKSLFVPLFGEDSIPSIYGFWGLVIVETISYFPTAFLVMVAIFSSIDPVLEEAAKIQGANRFKVFKDLILPLSLPGVYSSLLLIFIESLADFGNPLILSGNFKVLSVEAYLKITGEYDAAGGALLAIILLVPSLIAFFIQKYYVDKKSYVTMTGKPSTVKRKSTSRWSQVGLLSVCFGLTGFIFLFYGTVIFGSFVKVWGADNTLTIKNYIMAFTESMDYIKDSLLLSSIATPIAGIFGMIVAYIVVRKQFIGKTFLEVSSMLTFAVPGTVVGIGYILAFNEKPLLLTGTGLIIVILFVFRNAPVGIRSGIAALRQVDPAIEEASINLGASSLITFRKIVLPLIAPAFFSGLAYSFVRCMTAISAVIFVVSGQWNLVTVSILGFVENSYLSAASAMCIMLIIFVSLSLGLIRFAVSKMGVQHGS